MTPTTLWTLPAAYRNKIQMLTVFKTKFKGTALFLGELVPRLQGNSGILIVEDRCSLPLMKKKKSASFGLLHPFF